MFWIMALLKDPTMTQLWLPGTARQISITYLQDFKESMMPHLMNQSESVQPHTSSISLTFFSVSSPFSLHQTNPECSFTRELKLPLDSSLKEKKGFLLAQLPRRLLPWTCLIVDLISKEF